MNTHTNKHNELQYLLAEVIKIQIKQQKMIKYRGDKNTNKTTEDDKIQR